MVVSLLSEDTAFVIRKLVRVKTWNLNGIIDSKYIGI